MDQDQKKLNAAKASLDYIENGIILGVGTGSTVNHLIDLLPTVRDKFEAVVSSSNASSTLLEEQGFEVSQLNDVGDVDLYIDGADEATKHRQLIKGGGGALTREKIVAAAARRFVCIVDDTKLVDTLGTFPLPVEVIPMARALVARELRALGGDPVWRADFITDNGNQILDVHGLRISDPLAMETRINQLAGVVCTGIFSCHRADVLLVGGDDGVRTVTA